MLGFRGLPRVPQQPLELGLEVLDRQELVQRRVEQADHDGQPAHRPEDALEVAPLQLAEAVECGVQIAFHLGRLGIARRRAVS